MDKLWPCASMLLDSLPFIYFIYSALKNNLRVAPGRLVFFVWSLFTAVTSLLFFLPVPTGLIGGELLWLLRELHALLLFAALLVWVKKAFFKAVFVFTLVIPFSLGFTTLSSYISQFIDGNAPPYMISSILRFVLILLAYPVMIFLWRKMGVLADRLTDSEIWRFLWIIPTSAALAELFLVDPNYELSSLPAYDLLGRLAIWCGSTATCWLIFFLSNRLEQRIRLQESNEKSALLLTLQRQQYAELNENIEQARTARHDLRHHVNTISSLIEDRDYDRLREYVTQLSEALPVDRSIKICENYAANAILYHYIQKAQAHDVPIKVSFRLSNSSGISDSDLCVLLGNMVENAIEASSRISPDRRFITLYSLEEKDRIYITCDNSFSGEIRSADGVLLSSKRNFAALGIGLSSVRAVVAKYNGDIKIETEDSIFRLSILLTKP